MQSFTNWSIVMVVVAASLVSALTVAGLLLVWFRSRRRAVHGGEE